MKRNNEKGFTLAELLAVIAVLAVLIAVSIPVFGASVEKARAAVCLANRTSGQHAIIISELTQGTELTQAEAEAAVTAAIGELSTMCPSGGNCRVEHNQDGTWSVRCSIHTDTALQTVKNNVSGLFDPASALGGTKLIFDNNTEMSASQYIISYFKKYNSSALDSTGYNYGAPLKKALAQSLGISDEFDFKITKSSVNAGGYDLYVYDKVGELKAGDKVNVTGYRYTSVNGVLTPDPAGTGTEQSVTVRTSSMNGKNYNIINQKDYVW